MANFKPGDRVMRTRSAHRGRFAIVRRQKGTGYIIEFEDGPADAHNHEGCKPGMAWHAGESYIELAPPLPSSPFDAAVRAYIKQELNP